MDTAGFRFKSSISVLLLNAALGLAFLALSRPQVGRAGATYTMQGDAVAAEDREHATPAGASLGGPGGGH
jgi:hypothetical protein